MSELIERCADLARLGLSDRAIAERLGIHPNTVTKKRVLGGVRRPHPTITPEQEEQIHALADEGVSVNEIARTVGVSWPTVAKRRPDAVWSAQEAAEWGAFSRDNGGSKHAESKHAGATRRLPFGGRN